MFNKNCDNCDWNDGFECRNMYGQSGEPVDWDDICPGWGPNKKAEAQLVENVAEQDTEVED